jgi:hypothetical protein
MIGVDQVVVRVGKEGVSLVRPCPLRRRIGSRDEFRRHGRGGSKRRVIESGEILLRGAGRGFLDLFRLPLWARNRSLLVGVGSNQAGVDCKPVGVDRPSAMQRCTTLSKRRRSASLSRKRPRPFFENVEWSGTLPSSPSRQRWSRRAVEPRRLSWHSVWQPKERKWSTSPALTCPWKPSTCAS